VSDPVTTRGLRDRARRARADRLGLRLFDPARYRDVANLDGSAPELYRHFLNYGWLEGRDPNGWFSCAEYFAANPDVAGSGQNPWLHFIHCGRHERRSLIPAAPANLEEPSPIGPLTLEETLIQAARGLIDEPFYLKANPDVGATGLAAAEHFVSYGWQEGRTPAPWFNVEYLLTHTPSYRLGSTNPLVDLLRITTGIPLPVTAPTSWWVNFDDAVTALRGRKRTEDVLVVIHAFYPDDLDVFTKYLARLGPSVQVVITCPANTAAVCQRWAHSNGLEAVIVETFNRGRDWGPFLAVAQQIGKAKWEAVLKLHTKRSPHRVDGAEWLRHVLDGLVPDESTVSRVRGLLVNATCDIVAAPGTLSSAKGWKPEGRRARQLCEGIPGSADDFLFPAGSMFWMSNRILATLTGLAVSINDFEPELGQLDGTLAHSLERLVARLATEGISIVE
jgi:hypothetical protein